MNTRDLEAFVAVVETGSVVAASSRLHLTQPGVTRRVQSLEQMLGVNLLERPAKPLKPTPEGHHVYEIGRRLLRSVDELKSAFKPSEAFGGEFRLGVSPFVADTALTRPLETLRTAHPAMRIRVVSDWSAALVDMVRCSRLDAAVVYLPNNDNMPPDLHADEVARLDVVVVARRDAGFTGRVRLNRLKGLPWVLSKEGCAYRDIIQRAHERAGLPLDISVEATNMDVQLSLVMQGIGLGIVPLRNLSSSKWHDKLQVLSVPELDTTVSIWVTHRPPAGPLTTPIQHLREALRNDYDQQQDKLRTTRSRARGNKRAA
jgi:DNA-binding transcriptional LysR family regulator